MSHRGLMSKALFRVFLAVLLVSALLPLAASLAFLLEAGATELALPTGSGLLPWLGHLLMTMAMVAAWGLAALLGGRVPEHRGARLLAAALALGTVVWGWGYTVPAGLAGATLAGVGSTGIGFAGVLGPFPVARVVAFGGLGVAGVLFGRFGAAFPVELTVDDIRESHRRVRESPESLPSYMGGFEARLFRRLASAGRLGAVLAAPVDPGGWPAVAALRFVRSPWVWLYPVAATALALSWSPAGGPGDRLMPIAFVLLLLAPAIVGLFFLQTLHTVLDAEARRPLLWVALSTLPLVLALSASAFFFLGEVMGGSGSPGEWPMVIMAIALLAFFAGLFIAVFYHGVLDPSAAIRKTALYGTLGVILTVVFELAERGATATLVVWLGLPAGAGDWIGLILIVVLLAPLHDRVRQRTDRLLRDEGPDGE